MRRLMLLAVCALLVGRTLAALAIPSESLPPGCRRVGPHVILCDGEHHGGDGDNDDGGSSTTTVPSDHLIDWPWLLPGPPRCVTWVTRDLGRPRTQADLDQAEHQWFLYIQGGIPICPNATPSITPRLAAASFARHMDLPVPAPAIPPGKILVGLRAYLQTGATMTKTFHDNIAGFGPLDINARSVIHIDWGDDTGWDGPYTTPGGPYPDGEITHVYQYDGTYDVIVRQTWIADWALAGQTGTIDTGLQTTATLNDFIVEERQAVIK